MWPNRVADGSTRTTTPGILSDNREQEIEDAAVSSTITNGIVGVPAQPTVNINETSDSQSTTTLTSSNPSQTTSIDEFPILDELDRLAKVREKT